MQVKPSLSAMSNFMAGKLYSSPHSYRILMVSTHYGPACDSSTVLVFLSEKKGMVRFVESVYLRYVATTTPVIVGRRGEAIPSLDFHTLLRGSVSCAHLS